MALKNQVSLRLSTYELKTVNDLMEKGLTVRQIFQHTSCPCERCKNTFVSVYTDKGEEVLVPRGLLKIK